MPSLKKVGSELDQELEPDPLVRDPDPDPHQNVTAFLQVDLACSLVSDGDAGRKAADDHGARRQLCGEQAAQSAVRWRRGPRQKATRGCHDGGQRGTATAPAAGGSQPLQSSQLCGKLYANV